MELSLVGVAGCFFDWILTRPWKKLTLYFLPLIMVLFVIGLTAAGNWLNRNGLADRYLQLANAEVDEWEKQWAPKAESEEAETLSPAGAQPKSKEIPASAEMLFRRVQQLQQNDSRSMFFVAVCYLQRGATSQGLNMLNRLAPNDRLGYPPAHALLLEQLLAQPLKVSDAPILRHHAEGATMWTQISPQLLATISDLFAKLNDPDKAVDALNKAAARDKKYYLLLAQRTSGNPRFSKLTDEALQKASSHFTERLSKKRDDVGTILMLADTQRIQSDMEGAERTIREGMKVSDSPVLRSALSELYCQIFVKTAEFKEGSWTGNIELLEEAFHLDPNNLHVFEEVARLARVSGKAPNEELMAQLRENLVAGRATSITHMWIAEHYLNINQYAQAIPHLEQAVKRDPSASRCWNNLAYCLADLDSTRLDEALKDVDQAIALVPQMPDYHDTRGTILMKMKRPGDAVAAFERAVELIAKTNGAIPPQPAYHERLAEAYAAVGDDAMADTHKKFAVKLVALKQQAEAEAQAKSEATKSEATKSEATKSEATKSEATKSEATKSEAAPAVAPPTPEAASPAESPAPAETANEPKEPRTTEPTPKASDKPEAVEDAKAAPPVEAPASPAADEKTDTPSPQP